MKRSKLACLCFMTVAFLSFTGCNIVKQNETNQTKKKVDVKLFDEFTDIEIFQGIPIMTVENGKLDVKGDVGAGNQVATVSGSELEEYWTYLKVLEECGFETKYDNGEDGLYKKVFTTVMTKDEVAISVIHMTKSNLTYIIAERETELTEHLFYKDEYLKDNIDGANASLHMIELKEFGNSFVIQLKNGHFIMCDGGNKGNLSYLIDYLEELVPNGEKPVIEAWMISHQHYDHCALFAEFSDNWTYSDRIYVEGIYMDSYNSDIATAYGVVNTQLDVMSAALKLKTTDGKHPQIYRPQAGQRYYFSDVTVDVMQTLIQCPVEDFYRQQDSINEFSTWLMFNIDGQKFLNIGDADFGAMRAIMRTYDQEDLEVDIMGVAHHGINVHNEFTDFVSVNTLLYPNFGIYGSFLEGQNWGGAYQASVTRNEYLHTKVLESYCYLDGTVVLNFPYKVGTAKSLGHSRMDRVEDTNEHHIKYY